MLSAIRTKLLKVFIELDRNFGCLDNLDIDTDDYSDIIKLAKEKMTHK